MKHRHGSHQVSYSILFYSQLFKSFCQTNRVWSGLVKDSINLLNDLLQTDPKRRIVMQQLVYHPWVLKGYSSSVEWQTRYVFKDLDRECVAEIALFFSKSIKEINDHIQSWNYDFLTATYYLLLFMKLQGRPPKIKSNMKKYSQLITFNTCTTTSTVGQQLMAEICNNVSTNASQTTQANATILNRILIEKQLATLTTNCNGGTPRIATPSVSGKNTSVKIATKNPAGVDKANIENMSVQAPQQQHQSMVLTPHTKAGIVGHTAVAHSNKPKALLFDDIKMSNDDKNKATTGAKQREARSKTKVTPSKNNTISAGTAASGIQASSNVNKSVPTGQQLEQMMRLNKDSSPSSTSSSSDSSESLSASSTYSITSSNTSDATNFVMPSRVTRSRNK